MSGASKGLSEWLGAGLGWFFREHKSLYSVHVCEWALWFFSMWPLIAWWAEGSWVSYIVTWYPREKAEAATAATAAAATAKSLQSCLTLCNTIDDSPPGSSILGILQARLLEWVVFTFSNACMHAKLLQSYPILCDSLDGSPPGPSVPRILQAKILEWVVIFFSATTAKPRHIFTLLHPVDLRWSQEKPRFKELGECALAFDGKGSNIRRMESNWGCCL